MDQATEFPVSKLGDRYKIKSRSTVYDRIKALTKINPELKPHKKGNKSYVNAAILGLLDAMDRFIAEGYGVSEAAEKVCRGVTTSIQPDTDQTVSTEQSAIVSGVSGGAIAQNIENPTIAAIKLAAAAEPFGKYKMLDEVAANGWHLPSSEIGAILDRESLSGEEFELYGYRFVRMGEAGAESTWKVEKL